MDGSLQPCPSALAGSRTSLGLSNLDYARPPPSENQYTATLRSSRRESATSSYPNSHFTGNGVILEPDDIVIAVMGVTGAGKSTFISYFADEVVVGDGLMSCTQCVEPFFCPSLIGPDQQRVFLVDTPGFDDSTRTDIEILCSIATFLGETYHQKILLTGIIYLHRISDNKVGGSGLRQMRMFRKLCGDTSMKSIALVTTMWSLVTVADGERRERELTQKEGFWRRMIDSGSKFYCQDRDKESALEIVNLLMARKEPAVFDIQRELVDNHKRLNQTAAGKILDAELTRKREKYERELDEVRQEMKQALKEKDIALSRELQDVRSDIERMLEEERQVSNRLKANYEDLVRRFADEREAARQHFMSLVDDERRQRWEAQDQFERRIFSTTGAERQCRDADRADGEYQMRQTLTTECTTDKRALDSGMGNMAPTRERPVSPRPLHTYRLVRLQCYPEDHIIETLWADSNLEKDTTLLYNCSYCGKNTWCSVLSIG